MATGSVKRMWPAVLMAVLVVALAFFAMGASRTVIVGCGEDLDAVVNADPAATATRFQLSGCTYHVDNTVQPEDGDEIAGPVGTFIMRGPAYDPEPLATIQGSATLGQVMKPRGTFHGDWLQIFGGDFDGTAGSGVGLAGGDMDSDSVIYATQVANNEGAGVSNFHGLFWRSELTNNTTNPDALGFIGSGLKAVDEVWVGESYVHDTQGNGIWCDEECNDQPLSNGKFTVWYSLITNNGRDGVRWEKVGDEATHGEALVYLNEIHGNGVYERRAGVGVRDAQDITIRDNNFGSVTIADVYYGLNGYAWSATDSGRTDRPNLYNVDVFYNANNGDAEKGCQEPASIVLCN